MPTKGDRRTKCCATTDNETPTDSEAKSQHTLRLSLVTSMHVVILPAEGLWLGSSESSKQSIRCIRVSALESLGLIVRMHRYAAGWDARVVALG